MPDLLIAVAVLGIVVLAAVVWRRRARRVVRGDGPRPRVLVVGAGFGGFRLTRGLRDAAVDVTIVDRRNYHLFQPLLYQVASAALEPEEIAHTVRGMFQGDEHVRFRLGHVDSVDWERRRVELGEGEALDFDVLVLAAGAQTATFGVPGVDEHAFGLKHLEEAVALRSHVIRCFERVVRDPREIDAGALTFVLVGGGPTGVEMAGAFVELFDMVLRRDFVDVDVDRAQVVLVEAGDALLAPFDARLRDYTLHTLRRRGVDVRLGRAVEAVEGDDEGARAVVLDGGERIATQTVLWAAGVRANALADRLGLEQAGGGRVVVEPDLSVPGRGEVFVIGDMAAATDEHGALLPQLAPVAMQQADHVAAGIRRWRTGEAPSPGSGERFVYRDRGTMATIGRGAAVAQLPFGLRVTGFVAWQAWAWLHLFMLVGFRNRLNVWVNWVYSYFTYDRSARLILERRERE